MNETTKSIVIFTQKQSIIVRGIISKLKALGYKADVVDHDFKQLIMRFRDTDLFLVYFQSDAPSNYETKTFVKKAIEEISKAGINMAFIGEARYHDDYIGIEPRIKDYMWIDRPIDMENLDGIIHEAMAFRDGEKKKKRILIVDDDPQFATIIKGWIGDSYKVDIVTSGMQAVSFLLKQSKQDKVNLVLLDYEMPVVDGPQVLQMFRQEEMTKDIPVVFLTGNGTKEAVTRVMALKPEGYVLKSTSRDDLLAYLKGKLG